MPLGVHRCRRIDGRQPLRDTAAMPSSRRRTCSSMPTTERVLDARWDDLERPLPFGSLIKPFTALAYADAHRFTYPTFTCRGSADGCWLPAGHGRVGIVDAVAGSCNAYFRTARARRPRPTRWSTRLRWFGMRTESGDGDAGGDGRLRRCAQARACSRSSAGTSSSCSRAAQPGVLADRAGHAGVRRGQEPGGRSARRSAARRRW